MRRVVQSPATLFMVAVFIGIFSGLFVPRSEAQIPGIINYPDHKCTWINCTGIACLPSKCGDNWCGGTVSVGFNKCWPNDVYTCSENWYSFGSEDCAGMCGTIPCSCTYLRCG